MKKFSLLTLVCIGCFSVFAQDRIQLTKPMEVRTKFGVKAGVNLAEYDVNKAPTGLNGYNTSMKTSMNGGFLVNIPIGHVLRLQPEIMYSGQGSKTSFRPTASNATIAVEQDLRYINLPVMLQLHSTKGVYIEAGPQVGYLISAKNDGNAPYNGDIKSELEKLDVSVGAGIGYLSRVGLGVDARYNYGLTNVISEESKNFSGDLKNRVIQIGLFYQFGAGK
jgi:hypothetical protein